MDIDRGIWIEDLVRELPSSVAFLRDKGIRCLACGEPIWGTLSDAARDKGFSDARPRPTPHAPRPTSHVPTLPS